MSFLIFVYRHQDIIRRKSEINLKLSNLLSRLRDLQSYAAAVGDSTNGSMSMNDMMQVAPTQFGRMIAFSVFSGQAAQAGAMQNFNVLRNTGILQRKEMEDGVSSQQQQMYYEQMVQKNLFEAQQQKFADKEKKQLNKEETQIEQQKASLEDQLKMLSAEEETVTKAEDEGAKKSAPQYVA